MRTSGQSSPESLYMCLEVSRFPAQAVSAYNPHLRERAFAVMQQDAGSHRSRVVAVSAAAAALGAEPGMPVHVLRRRFGRVEAVPRDRALEAAARDELGRIAGRYTPAFEVNGRGQCLLCLSGTPAQRAGQVERIAAALQAAVRREIGLEETAVGIARSRLLARALAGGTEPGTIRCCPPGEEETALAGLEAGRLPGLSARCREKLRKYGLRTVGQVRRLAREALAARFGAEGEKLYSLARGLDPGPGAVAVRQLQAEIVLDHDVNDRAVLHQAIRHTADRLCHELRLRDLQAGGVGVVLRYTDGQTVRKTVRFPVPTYAFEALSRAAATAFEALSRRRAAVRSVRLTASRLQGASGQLSLFADGREQGQERVSRAVVEVRKKMGFDAVFRASAPDVRRKETR